MTSPNDSKAHSVIYFFQPVAIASKWWVLGAQEANHNFFMRDDLKRERLLWQKYHWQSFYVL